MSEGSRTIRIVTNDEALLASVRAAVAALEGWRILEPQSVEDILATTLTANDVILLDGWQRAENVYESSRRLTGKARCRVFVITDQDNRLAEPIAMFCGASGTITRPLSASKLREAVERASGPLPKVPAERRRSDPEDAGERALPERLLRDLVGERSERLVDVMIDPETGLYGYDYLKFKLDEEFKRAQRFDHALSCVMLGFEGQVDDEVLRELASIFLNASRDTDILGRFDQSSFLFFLPDTGPDGAEVMARRIREAVETQGLRDLVGDSLRVNVGISYCPHHAVRVREDLFSRAREAFLSGQREGGVVVRSD